LNVIVPVGADPPDSAALIELAAMAVPVESLEGPLAEVEVVNCTLTVFVNAVVALHEE
jgi:hypothetical protein